jgi:glutamine phosphoribosylpyrophosphate amidotransferase
MKILQAQEHRGTSSTGVAYFNSKGTFVIEKDTVSPAKFAKKHIKTGAVVLGHNRMPSHGAVTKENSHPFFDCKHDFALVHNGSESLDGLGKLMKQLGHRFRGETDSEIITHTIEEFAKKKPFAKAIFAAHEDIYNSNLLILTKSGEMYGIGGNNIYLIKDTRGIYIASEEDSFIPLFDGKKKTVIKPKSLFHITSDGRLFLYGKYDKTEKLIEKKVFSGYIFSDSKDKKWKKEVADDYPPSDDEDFGDLEEDDEECDCAESEVAWNSIRCDKCGKRVARGLI